MISGSEYRLRQERLRSLSAAADFDVVVAWGRGATQDHYADLFYLTGFCPQQPYVPDFHVGGRWSWRASGHCAVVVPVQGPVTLIAEAQPERMDAQPFDRLVVTSDVVGAVAAVIDETPPTASRVAVLGGAAIAARWWQALVEQLAGRATLIESDDLAWALRTVKSIAEQACLRTSGGVGSRAMVAGLAAAVPGASEAEVAAALISEVARNGGAMLGLGISSGPRADTFAPAGGPFGATPFTDRRLAAGDVIRLDAYGSVGGYLFDLARSRVVGDAPTDEQQMLLDAVRVGVQAGIEALRPGITLGAVAHRCDEALAGTAYSRRYGMPASTMDGAWGHGLGLSFEPPWIEPTSRVVAEPGMCFAIERRIAAPGAGRFLAGAQYEDEALITDDGAEVLTPSL
jgi:Xaa-Pro aminopeptidase